MPRMDMLSIQAREMVGMPEDWEAYHFESFPKLDKTIYVAVTGSVAPLFTKGKNKGKRNYVKEDKSTLRTVNITTEASTKFAADWETRTGNCAECMGTGEVFVSWNHETGTKNRPCPICHGTGKRAETAVDR